MKIESSLYERFGVTKPRGLATTPTMARTIRRVDDVVTDKHWIAIHGEIASGKTETVHNALEQARKQHAGNVRVVELYWPDRSGINIAEVLNQIIYTLGPEFIGTGSPKRGKEVRMYQVLDILVEAKRRGIDIVLVIDEAHELHIQTIKALKRLWEYKFKGDRDLLGIILVGQPPLEMKLRADMEVRLRAYRHEFAYDDTELATIASHVTKGMLTHDECVKVGKAFDRVGTMIAAIREAMVLADRMGEERLELRHIHMPEEPKAKTPGLRPKVDKAGLEALTEKLSGTSVVGRAV